MSKERKVIDMTKEIIEEEPQEDLVDILEKDIEDWKTKYKYLLADLMNTKKRYQTLLDNSNKYKEENILKDLLQVIDDFDRMFKIFEQSRINEQENNSIYLIYDKLINVLTKYDVKPIYEERPIYFNSEYDEAILSNNIDDIELDNTIKDIVEKGYMYKDKVLRYEKVIVNKYNKDEQRKEN